MDALDVVHVAIKLINTIVKICEFVLKFSEIHSNAQRISEEGSEQLFSSFILLNDYLLFIICINYLLYFLFMGLIICGVPGQSFFKLL